ncbi:hemerythrin domain-containing protein [Actinophytocola algeriensis]|uniref:Hemerythrin superfamily protein n=1 Tax=Actinophytocola algeriensis TaxID=1768010 RepID=A0A7W7Q376_9PSEU|nr:hemerythrin domain-containing protein [Actinophytocola algeriensis]MBB4906227.1 hemerythrin superfamily protein [Actinophytocola algeriensis]MBE1472088.1 hemerythrin superfamily protein [Actinophytocola algeriensis]
MSTDAIVLLKEDHKEIRRLFREFQSAETKRSKGAAMRRVVKALTIYSYLENECMHPELRKRLPDLEDDVLRSYEENHVAEVLCTELAAMTPDDERFNAKATVLIETVSRHFGKEEEGWFPQVREGLGRKQLQEIGAQMIKLRKKAPRKPAQLPGAATVTGDGKPDGSAEQDVVDLLLRQHTQIRDLFIEVESATGKARTDAFQRLVRLLAVHETAEEQVVHPLTRLRVHGGDDIVDDRLAEEHSAKETLAELEKMGPDAPEFPQLLDQLRIDVLDHASKEEAYEFRYLRREVGGAELRTMTAAVKAAEAVAPTHPHPGVESATANTLAGPALSLFDRTKDLVQKAITAPS